MVTGDQLADKICDEQQVGYSLLIEGNQYYLMRLFLFDKYFFIVKKPNSNGEYTVYGSKLPNEPVFKNPLGTATLRPDFKSYLEVDIPLLGSPLFMSLFPN
jgi:hypothetical protein